MHASPAITKAEGNTETLKRGAEEDYRHRRRRMSHKKSYIIMKWTLRVPITTRQYNIEC